MSKKRRIVYMGTPEFAVSALQALVDEGHNVVAVFSQPDKPAGRGKKLASPPVKVRAEELGLPVYQPPKLNHPDVVALLKELAPEAIVVAAYAQLLPRSILTLPQYGCINIHASLLPKYRGGAPIHWAIVQGETRTGITIMQMDRGLDTGDIILQESLPIAVGDTCEGITLQLADLGAKLLLRCLELEDVGQSLRRPQDSSQSSFARNVKKEDGRIDWSNAPRAIHDLVRGFNPWPGAFTFLHGLRLVVLNTKLPTKQLQSKPLSAGDMELIDGELHVGTGEGNLIVTTVLPAGKRKMSGEEFYRGYVSKRSSDQRSFTHD